MKASMKTNCNFSKVLLTTIFCCAICRLSNGQVYGIPYSWLDANGIPQTLTAFFPNGSYSEFVSCPANHKDPNGANYAHVHTDGFDFPVHVIIVNPDGSVVKFDVTAAMSDAFWATQYPPPYIKLSGSTFSQNCYSFVTGAPTPMMSSAWYQWTTLYLCCEGSKHGTSVRWYGDDHVIDFVEAPESCLVVSTMEKCNSGPVEFWSGPGYGSACGFETRQNIK
jgi:hypothetical protein